MFKKLLAKKPQQIIGLDIGTRYVKALLLELHQEQYTILSTACEPINGNAFSEREIKNFEAVSNALKKVKLALKSRVENVAIAVSGASVITKIIYMDPEQTDAELESQIEIEADSLIPYPLDDVYVDFEEIGISQNYPDKVEVLLSAAHKDTVDRRITLLGEVGYEATIVDIETYALGTAMHYFCPQTAEKATQIQYCINIGASQMQFCALESGKLIYNKDHNFGIDTLVQEMCITYSLDRIIIEQQMLAGTLPASWRQDCYPTFLANLQQHINRAVQMYVTATHHSRPTQLWISGGASNLAGLNTDLEQELGVEVTVFNPLANMDNNALTNQPLAALSPHFAIAAGLATRSLSSCHI
ncbi:MAG: type IV pilus assembly protein PilM [Paraglaciecola sp.]